MGTMFANIHTPTDGFKSWSFLDKAAYDSMTVNLINEVDFESEVLDSTTPVIVNFFYNRV